MSKHKRYEVQVIFIESKDGWYEFADSMIPGKIADLEGELTLDVCNTLAYYTDEIYEDKNETISILKY